MSYSYLNDYASFYPTSSAREEFDGYQLLDQTPAAQGVNYQVPRNTFTDFWGTFEQSGLTEDSTTTLPSTVGHELPAPATSHINRTDGYSQLSYSSHHWPEIDWQAQTYPSGSSSQDFPPASMTVAEQLAAVPTPSNVSLGHWGETQSGPSASTSYTDDVHAYHQPGQIRTRRTQARQFQPYGISRARLNEHRNAEAGPSTLVPPPIPYVSLPTLQPSGGYISETTANAEKNQTFTEEDKIATPKRTRVPRGKGPPRPHREQAQEALTKICDWFQRRERLRELPIINVALAAAVETIMANRSPEYHDGHRLKTGNGKRNKVGLRSADGEFERRNEEREQLRKLSKYYQLRQNQRAWTRSKLLSLAVEDLGRISGYNLSVPPGPFDQPPP